MKMPLMFELKDKQILVVGGGKVGYQKSKKLIRYGAQILCVSKEHSEAFTGLEACRLVVDKYDESYIQEVDMVIAATNNRAVNDQIYLDCQIHKILCMRVDQVNQSDISFMATKEKEGLTVAVSTSGSSPNFSKKLVEQLMETVTEEAFRRLKLMRAIRVLILKSKRTKEERQRDIRSCVSMSISELEAYYSNLSGGN